jgi:hypothetical protein
MVVAPESSVSVPAPSSQRRGRRRRGRQDRGHRVEEQSNFPMSDAEALTSRAASCRRARVLARFVALNPELTPEQADVFARELANKVAHDAARAAMSCRRRAGLSGLAGAAPWAAQPIVVSAGFAQDPTTEYHEVVTRSSARMRRFISSMLVVFRASALQGRGGGTLLD